MIRELGRRANCGYRAVTSIRLQLALFSNKVAGPLSDDELFLGSGFRDRDLVGCEYLHTRHFGVISEGEKMVNAPPAVPLAEHPPIANASARVAGDREIWLVLRPSSRIGRSRSRMSAR